MTTIGLYDIGKSHDPGIQQEPRGISKYNLPGYVGFFQFLRNFRHQNAFKQAEMILQATLDPAIASRARRGEFVTCFDHFNLLQTARN